MEFGDLSKSVLADVARCLAAVDVARVAELVDAIAQERTVLLAGTGRSGLVLRAMAVRLGHLGVRAHVAGEPGCPSPRPGDLVLVGSGSGRTPVALARAEQARAAGARIALITAAPASPIAKMSDLVVHVPADAAPRDGTPHTLRSLFEECLFVTCDCVCKMLQQRFGLSAEEMQSRHSTTE